tara:strand:- start:4331 stop:4612 length:282 start_codon:yes stop_codon:yes gene_type:complete
MAYVTDNPPIMKTNNISTQKRTGTNSVSQDWYYNSADALATQQGAGYFTNATELGMKVGDNITVAVSGVRKTPEHYVSAISAAGAGTISAATV